MPPIDAQQACAFATNAQHERLSSYIHTIILVGNATEQRRYYQLFAAPARNLL